MPDGGAKRQAEAVLPFNASSSQFVFHENRGQLVDADFAARGAGYAVSLVDGAARLTLTEGPMEGEQVELRVAGGGPAPLAVPLDEQPGVVHDLRGGRDQWVVDIHRFGRVRYQDVLPGVDVEYYGHQRSLEFDLVVDPGIDAASIALELSGVDVVRAEGDTLALEVAGQVATLLPPVIYQVGADGERAIVEGHYRVEGDRRVAFDLGRYDTTQPLVIDPTLVYGSYLGGSDSLAPPPGQYDYEDDDVEGIRTVGLDASGNIYLAGATNAPDFPGSVCEGPADCEGRRLFITKLSPDGETLLWTSLLGESAYSSIGFRGFAVTPGGNAVVVSNAGSEVFALDDYADGLDPIDPTCADRGQAYLLMFNESGLPTLAGQLPMTRVDAITASPSGFVVAGAGAGIPYIDFGNNYEQRTCVPETQWGPGLPEAEQGGGAVAGYTSEGVRTFLTGIRVTGGRVATDPSGAIALVGGNRLVKLAPNGTEIAFSVALPAYISNGSVSGYAYAGADLVMDRSGGIYLATTGGSSLPVTEGAFQPVAFGRREVYVAKVSPAGALEWATFLGGEDDDVVKGIAVDEGGSLHVVGNTASFRGPLSGAWVEQVPFPYVPDPGPYRSSVFSGHFHAGSHWDGFYTRLAPDGSVVHSSVFGGVERDIPFDVEVGRGGEIVIVGQTRSRDMRMTNTGVQQGLADFSFIGSVPADGFVYKVADGIAFPRLPTAADYPYSGVGGDPIDTFTGELYFTAVPDLEVGGLEALSFQRYYASGLRRSGALGRNWRHGFEWALEDEGDIVTVTSFKGRELRFSATDAGYESVGGLGRGAALVEDGGEWVLAEVASTRAYRFNAAGQLIRITSPHRVINVTPGAHGPASATDGVQTFTFLYDSEGALSAVDNGARSVTFTVVDDQLLSVTDPLSRTTQYIYDDGHDLPGLLLAQIDPEGTSGFTQTFDEEGRVATQSSFEGRTWSYAYQSGTTTITDPDAFTTVHEHDARGLLRAVTDELGRVTELGATGPGDRASVRTTGGANSSMAYDEAGALVGLQMPSGATTETTTQPYPLDGVPLPLAEELLFADGTTELYGRDAAGRITSVTTRNNQTWTYAYNGQGRLETVTDPNGLERSYTYDAAGNVLTSTDPHGVVTTLTYDTYGRVASRTTDGDTELTTWDDAGQLHTFTDARGGIITLNYDDNGRVATVENALGNTASFTYDPQGHVLTSTDELGGTITFTYNDRGDLLTASDENGDGATLVWDAAGQLVAATDDENDTITRAYNDDGQLVGLTRPDGETATYAYDDAGRLVSVTTPEGRTWSTRYNAAGYPASVTDPAGHQMHYGYDAHGRLAELVAPGGLTVAVGRTGEGAITGVQLPRGGVWSADIDLAGRLLSTTDPVGATTTFGYDNKGRVQTVTGPETVQTHTHDANDNVTGRTFSDGLSLTQAYDALDRRTTGTGLSLGYDLRGAIIESNGLVLTRDPAAWLTAIELAPGKSLTFTQDRRGRVTSMSDWTGATLTFEHDNNGWLTAVRRPNGVDTEYTYDRDGLLVRVHDVSGASTVADQVLTRGARGFVTHAARTLPTVASSTGAAAWTASYDLADRLAGASYDGAGNMTAQGGRTFGYDDAGRMTAFDPGTGARSYTFDGLGAVIGRTDGVTETYVWNYGLSRPTIQIVRVGGVDDTYLLTSPTGAVFGVIDASTDTHRYFHLDESGNLRFTTDDSGTVVGTFAHSPYGEALSVTGVPERFTWLAGHGVLDDGDGVFLMRERAYDATTARFTSRDPVEGQLHPLAANPYGYAAGNPIHLADPGGATPHTAAINAADQFLNGSPDPLNMGPLSQANTYAGMSQVTDDVVGGLARYAARRVPPGKVYKVGSKVFGRQEALRAIAEKTGKLADTPLNKAGERLFAAAAAWELVKGRDRMQQALDDSKRNAQSNLDTFDLQRRAVDEMRRTKRITPERAEELFRQIRENYDYLEGQESRVVNPLPFVHLQVRQLGTFTEGALTLKNALGAASPVPLDWIGLGDPQRPYVVR